MFPVSTRISAFLGFLILSDLSVHVRVHVTPLTLTIYPLSTKCPVSREVVSRKVWVVSPGFPFLRLCPWYVGVRISIRVAPDAYLVILPNMPLTPTGVACLLVLVLVLFWSSVSAPVLVFSFVYVFLGLLDSKQMGLSLNDSFIDLICFRWPLQETH